MMQQQIVRINHYGVREGAPYSQGDAAIVGPELERLAAEKRLDATNVVQVASPRNSTLHPFFEWDNLRAAHEHRLNTARKLIGAIVIPAHGEQPEITQTHRAFVAIPRRDPAGDPMRREGQRGPVPCEFVSRDEAEGTAWMREHLRKKALRMLLTWEGEYESWASADPAFQPTLAGIRETKERLEMESAAAKMVEAA